MLVKIASSFPMTPNLYIKDLQKIYFIGYKVEYKNVQTTTVTTGIKLFLFLALV